MWRFRNPTSRAYSYFYPVHKTYSRIDYFFLDKRILHLTKECDYGAMVISDHGPLIMKMYIPDTQSTYRAWRFNPLLLSEDEFTKFISSEVSVSRHQPNPRDVVIYCLGVAKGIFKGSNYFILCK